MRVVYSPRYRIDLGLHVFPTEKYRLVHERLLASGLIQPSDGVEPATATWEELALVHTAEYLAGMRDGTMTDDDIAQLELPWSREMVDGFRVMVGGTIEAALRATGSWFDRLTTSEINARPEPFDSPLILSLSKDERLAQDKLVDQPPRFALRRSAVALAKAEGRAANWAHGSSGLSERDAHPSTSSG